MIHNARKSAPLLICACLLLLLPFVFTGPDTLGANDGPPPDSRISTLHVLDPLLNTLSMRDGGAGSVFKENAVYNRQSDINYSSMRDGEFTVGIEGNNRGWIVDLGSPLYLSKKYGYEETSGNGQGYASIGLRLGKISLLKNYCIKNTTPIAEAEQLFAEWDHDKSHAPVKLGHIYLVRITDGTGRKFELIAKLLVIGYRPGESVTFRWDIIKQSP
jgi:hypothetical protein